MGDPIKPVDDLAVVEVRPRRCRESLTGIAVRDGQFPERIAVEELVRHEVPSPDIVRDVALGMHRPIAVGAPPPRAPGSDRQAFFTVDAIGALVVDPPKPAKVASSCVSIVGANRGERSV